MLSASIPPPDQLRAVRESLGLSQPELAAAIGVNDDQVVRAWEQGQRQGRPFQPTPLAWAALRYLALAAKLYGQLPHGSTRHVIGLELPEAMR